MPFSASFAEQVASVLVELDLVLDPLVAFGIRGECDGIDVSAEFRIFCSRSLGGNSASGLGSWWFRPVGWQECFSLPGSGIPGLRSTNGSVVYRIDKVYPALVPYHPTLALEV